MIDSPHYGELFQDHIWPIVSTNTGLTEDTEAVFTASSVVDERNEKHNERSRRLVRPLYRAARPGSRERQGGPTSSSGRGRWWLHVIGKATPEGGLPVSMALVRTDFVRYKTFQGLPSVPSPHEPGPAVMRITGDDA